MNVSKIQRLSADHEDLSAFLKVSCISGAYLSIKYGAHEKHLESNTSMLIMVAIRNGIKEQLDKIESEIKAEAKHV